MLSYLFSLLVLLFTMYVSVDAAASCTYEDALGLWKFDICETRYSCMNYEKLIIALRYPNLAVDDNGNRGTWTLIKDDGFEITIANRKWLVIFAWGPFGESFCHEGRPSWTHDTLIRQWKSFNASKIGQTRIRDRNTGLVEIDLDRPYMTNHEFVRKINAAQNSWEATGYPELSQLTLRDILRRAGALKSAYPKLDMPKGLARVSNATLKAVRELPREFDWRQTAQGNLSVVPPVRDQGVCGSGYAFASLAALEARIRIVSNFSHQPILSPQDVVDCSPYTYGCERGVSYLVAGKYAEDFGIPKEECYPYEGADGKCRTPTNCTRYYATKYAYIGGYYGASNEYLMQLELIHRGPFPVALQVHEDFMKYKRGVYRHTGIADSLNRFDPFVLTDHAVVIVGYGTDKATGLPYWTVLNSWGKNWGEDGFFRILRGKDECGIESLSMTFDPVL